MFKQTLLGVCLGAALASPAFAVDKTVDLGMLGAGSFADEQQTVERSDLGHFVDIVKFVLAPSTVGSVSDGAAQIDKYRPGGSAARANEVSLYNGKDFASLWTVVGGIDRDSGENNDIQVGFFAKNPLDSSQWSLTGAPVELAAGAHYFKFEGTPQMSGASYRYNVGVMAAAVPEPEEWLMMLSGLGLLGTLLRRRSRQGGQGLGC